MIPSGRIPNPVYHLKRLLLGGLVIRKGVLDGAQQHCPFEILILSGSFKIHDGHFLIGLVVQSGLF